MCTAVSYRGGSGLLFGRTLDVERSFGEEVVFCPRNFRLQRGGGEHYAVLGMATVREGYPLYYDGMNEVGLCMAGLNFPHTARYRAPVRGGVNVAQYEVIPYVLGSCATTDEAERALKGAVITAEPFAPDIPPAPLHWMISDGRRDIAVERAHDGMHIYENAVGVLTNQPSSPAQLFNLGNYMALSSSPPQNAFAEGLRFSPYCFGMGAMGLPGDWSSQSRFVRAAFVRNNYRPAEGESAQNGLIRMLSSVWVPMGAVRGKEGWAATLCLCCMDAAELSYTFVNCLGPSPVTLPFGDAEGEELFRRAVFQGA